MSQRSVCLVRSSSTVSASLSHLTVSLPFVISVPFPHLFSRRFLPYSPSSHPLFFSLFVFPIITFLSLSYCSSFSSLFALLTLSSLLLLSPFVSFLLSAVRLSLAIPILTFPTASASGYLSSATCLSLRPRLRPHRQPRTPGQRAASPFRPSGRS